MYKYNYRKCAEYLQWKLSFNCQHCDTLAWKGSFWPNKSEILQLLLSQKTIEANAPCQLVSDACNSADVSS